MSATRVLVVEDDPNIIDLVRSNLLVRGFEVKVTTTGLPAVSLVESYEPEIVLLDLMLPDADGFDICRDIRQQFDVGLIVVSARAGEHDKVRALNLGADDYLTKPFGIEELLARMTATLRRSRVVESAAPAGDIVLGDIRVGLDAKAVYKNGERVQLTPTEFSLLRFLALNAGTLLSYEQLLREVWGRGYENSREYVRVYVGRLRSKLEDEDRPPLIVTEPRAGYRLVLPDESV
ncbi:MAG: response regulator transcription factor [Acidimicrobiales bacterium]